MSLLDTASLLLTPNAYKEGKLYSVIPSDGSGDFTFTRATTATRVNSDGLVELVPYNLLQRSEEFNNAYWNKNGGSISANSSTAPNGTLTADRLTLAATTATHGLIDFGVGGVAASTYTVSFYVKKGTHRYITIGIYRNTLNNAGAGFDLDTNTVTGTGATGTGYSASGATMTDVGDGWYRCFVVCVSGTTPMTGSGLFLRNTSYTSGAIQESWAASGTETINLWGAQLVEGTNALPYQKTETRLNIPRLDYSLGGCPNILLEPQRTNLLTYSSSFDTATWIKSRCVASANTTISPSGVQDAETITETTFTNNFSGVEQAIAVINGTTYTQSVFVKRGNIDFFSVGYFIVGGATGRVIYNLNTKLVTNSSNITSSSITDFPNGWVRISITYTANATNTNYAAYFHTKNSGAVNYNGNGTGFTEIWGAQLEAGSYATSYIPTTTASVTRNADIASKTGISSLIGQTEGTLFVEMKALVNGGVVRVISLSDGTTQNRITIEDYSSADFIVSRVTSANAQVAFMVGSPFPQNIYRKIAVKYKLNDCAIFINGVKIAFDTSVNMPISLSDLRFDSGAGAEVYNGNVKTLAIYKTALTDDECIQLTTI